MKFYIVVKTTEPEAYTLLTDHAGSVLQFPTKTKGIRYYEDGYNRKHRQSYEGSMSACINAMFFQPSVIGFASLDDLGKIVARDEDGVMSLISMRNVSGGISGIPCKLTEGAAMWEKGAKPRLIS